MDIEIDIEAPEPIFAQLIEQVKQAVLKNTIKPGDALPSIRQLAADLEVNSKTVAKAYSLLERDEVIQSRGYRGTFVHPNAKANSKVDLNAWVHTQLSDMLAKFRQAGVTDSEIRIAFGSVMNSQKG